MENTTPAIMPGESTQSADIGKLAEALSKAQGEMNPVHKDGENPFFKSKYSTLQAVMDACREPLVKNGLAIIQTMTGTDGYVGVKTTLAHTSGQFISGTLLLKPVKTDPQAAGSAITYMRRYSVMAMVGLVPDEDDDGEKAMDRKPVKPKLDFTPEQKEQGKQIHAWIMAEANNNLQAASVKLDNLIGKNKFSDLTPKDIDILWESHSGKVEEFLKAGG